MNLINACIVSTKDGRYKYLNNNFYISYTNHYIKDDFCEEVLCITLDDQWQVKHVLHLIKSLQAINSDCICVQVHWVNEQMLQKLVTLLIDSGFEAYFPRKFNAQAITSNIFVLRKDIHQRVIQKYMQNYYLGTHKVFITLRAEGTFTSLTTKAHLFETDNDYILMFDEHLVVQDIFWNSNLELQCLDIPGCALAPINLEDSNIRLFTSIYGLTFLHQNKHFTAVHGINVCKCEEKDVLFRFMSSLHAYSNVCAHKIQKAFRRAMSEPSFTLCRKRLMAEFDFLNNSYISTQ
jgi:hypothetical protein